MAKMPMNLDSGQVVVLISANIEWQALRTVLPEVEIKASPYGEWFTTAIQPAMPLLFFHGGWGKIAAAGSTQYVIDCWKPELLPAFALPAAMPILPACCQPPASPL